MLELLRSFMKSKVGVIVSLGFLVLIALAFAAADVSGNKQFGSVTGGDRVATVGNRQISTSDLSQAATNALDQVKQDNPGLTMKLFVSAGGLTRTLDEMIDRAAITVFGANHGIAASDRVIDSEIAKIPAFQGPDGKFSETVYKQLLRQRGISEAALRQDVTDGLVARQVLVPAAFGARLPTDLVTRYATLLTERRSGAIAMLPATAFAPKQPPAEAEVAKYYAAHRNDYVRPERRVIRYAVFDDSVIKAVPAPTDAEIAARYNATKAQFLPSESRRLTRLVLPTEPAAQAIAAELAGGKPIEAAAAAKGLATSTLGPITRDALAAQANDAVAAAAFATAKGKISAPVHGPLGWELLRVDAVESKAGKTLEQAKPEIIAELTATKKRAALSDFSAGIEDQFDKGSSLGDVAKQLGLQLKETPPLVASGKVYMDPAKSAPPELARIVPAAFAMEREGQPQLAEVVAGKQLVVFDVTSIAASAAAPLAEIRAQVASDQMLEMGGAAARAAAEKVQAQVKKGTDLAAAVASLGVPVPPTQRLDMSRQDLTKQGPQIPPPLALMFSMAQGTSKVLAGPRNMGWYVVSLAKITPGKLDAKDPMIAQAGQELSAMAGREFADQLRAAAKAEVGAKKNQAGIDAVARQLSGAN